MSNLYEKIGGEAAVMAAVDVFYKKVLADERTRPFFEELNMDAQIRKQVGFMSHAFGGPEEYKGRDLRNAHAGLVKNKGLNDSHFDAIAGHLHDTLVELGVERGLIDEALRIVASTRDEVLGR